MPALAAAKQLQRRGLCDSRTAFEELFKHILCGICVVLLLLNALRDFRFDARNLQGDV